MRAAVEWVAEGGLLTEFLGRLQAENVVLTRVRRQGERLQATVSASDYRKLRAPARRTGTRVRILRKRGWAFRTKRWRGRHGLWVGGVLAAVLLWQLSERIWVILPDGLAPAQQAQVLEAVEEMGVAVGAPIRRLQHREISLRAIHDLRQVIALTVNMDGCIAHVDVVADNTNHPLSVDIRLSDLVATRDGLVLSTEITKGKRVVKSGEGVTAGTLLATGAVDTEHGLAFGRAAGIVLARTERKLTVEVPLKQVEWQASGRSQTATSFTLFGLTFPLSAPLNIPATYRLETDSDRLTTGGLPLPIGFERERVTPLKAVEKQLSEQQAQQQAYALLTVKETAELGEAEIEKRTVETTCENGVFRLTASYNCIENIAEERPVTVVENKKGR